MTQFKKKPAVVSAWPVKELNHLAQHDWYELPEAIREDYENPKGKGGWVFGALLEDDTRGIWVPTLEGSLLANSEDWIIRGVAGEFYPCKRDIFLATYNMVDPELPSDDIDDLREETPNEPFDRAMIVFSFRDNEDQSIAPLILHAVREYFITVDDIQVHMAINDTARQIQDVFPKPVVSPPYPGEDSDVVEEVNNDGDATDLPESSD